MTYSALLALVTPPLVHAKPDASRTNPDGQSRHKQQEQGQRQEKEEPARPVPNIQGQVTGKVIDTTA
ncbi:MAG: hypothetical protein AB1642_11550 [Pseudomonadota bacterium]